MGLMDDVKELASDVKDTAASLESAAQSGANIVNNPQDIDKGLSPDKVFSADQLTISPTFISTSQKLIWCNTIFVEVLSILSWISLVFLKVDTTSILVVWVGIYIAHLTIYSAKSIYEKVKGVNNPDTVVNPNCQETKTPEK